MNCPTCDKPLSARNKSGYCTYHVAAANAADPEWRRKQREGSKRALDLDPVRKAAMRDRIRIVGKLPHATEARRRAAVNGRLWEQGHAAIKANPECRAMAGARQSETKMGWCPRELRDHYRYLVYSVKIPAPEARAMILEKHGADMARFTRKMEALAA